MKPQKKIVVLLGIIILGYIVYGIYSYIVRCILKMDYPNGTFLFNSVDQYMDFFNVNFMVHEWNSYIEYYSSYPPLALLLAYPFSLMADYASYEYPPLDIVYTLPAKISFGLFVGIFTLLIVWLVNLYLKRAKVIKNPWIRWIVSIGLTITAPYLFMVDRGNYLIITIILMLAFIYFYEDHEYVSAIFLGLAIALKIYPMFLFLLLFIDKRWKSMGLATIVGGGVTVLTFPLFHGGIWQNIREFGAALLAFGGGYVEEYSNVYFCTGLTSLLRMPFMIWNDCKIPETFPLMKIYVFGGTALVLWSVWNLKKEQRFWKKILILLCLMVFLTPSSYMYNLMYFLPATLLLLVADDGGSKKTDTCYLVLMGLILIPKAYYYFIPEHFVGIQTILDSCLLLSMVLFYNIADKETRRC